MNSFIILLFFIVPWEQNVGCKLIVSSTRRSDRNASCYHRCLFCPPIIPKGMKNNLFTIAPENIRDVKVLLTIVDGRKCIKDLEGFQNLQGLHLQLSAHLKIIFQPRVFVIFDVCAGC